ncbi:hypothetical protein JCM10212_001380 [Sporobolomyces blumeae]
MPFTETTSDPIHVANMRLALSVAQQSTYVPTAFCVGCVLTTSPDNPTWPNRVLVTGFSRELPGNTHAEQCALDKVSSMREWNGVKLDDGRGGQDERERLLRGAVCYTTMEPCSQRLSGNVPCVERILETGIETIVVGVEEPKDFVECEGTRILRERGRTVLRVVDPNDPLLGDKCLKVARGESIS